MVNGLFSESLVSGCEDAVVVELGDFGGCDEGRVRG